MTVTSFVKTAFIFHFEQNPPGNLAIIGNKKEIDRSWGNVDLVTLINGNPQKLRIMLWEQINFLQKLSPEKDLKKKAQALSDFIDDNEQNESELNLLLWILWLIPKEKGERLAIAYHPYSGSIYLHKKNAEVLCNFINWLIHESNFI